MSPAAPQHMQNMILSIVSFMALGTNFLVAFAPLPQAITVHQRKSAGSLRMSVYHLTCVNYLYASLYAVEIKNMSVMFSSAVNWLVTVAFTIQLLLYSDQSQRLCGWLLLAACFVIPVASAHACHSTARDCVDLIGTLNNVFNVVSFGAPLVALRTVWLTSDASSMPTSVSLMNLMNSTSWWLFGRMLADPYISFSNGLGALLSVFQVAVILKVSHTSAVSQTELVSREHSV